MTAETPKPTLHVGTPRNLFRFNGIGTALVGGHKDPAVAPWYFKRFAYTVLFIPIYLGRYYAVQRARRTVGWKVAGWISPKEFRQRYGLAADLAFTGRVMALPLIILAAFVVIFINAFNADEASLREKRLSPHPAPALTPASSSLSSGRPA